MPSFFSSSLLKRAAVGLGLGALAVGAVGVGAASATQPASLAIDTISLWDGTTNIQSFGCPNTSTYGQSVTIPDGMTKFHKVTFEWTDTSTGSFKVRGELYGWDSNTMEATTKVAQTQPRKVTSGHDGFYTETFKFRNAAVTPGQQYVVFATLDKNYRSCTDSSYVVGWGAIGDDTVYPGGTFVFQNNGGEGGSANWTTVPWNSFGYDLAFRAYMS